MALLRVMHATDMPDPGALVRKIEGLLQSAASAAPVVATPGTTQPVAIRPSVDWPDLVERVEAVSPLVAATMRLAVRVIRVESGLLSYELAPGITADPSADIRRALEAATGERWQVERGEGKGAPSLEEERATRAAEEEAAMHDDPLVKAVMAAFPEARIVDDAGADDAGARPWSKRA